VIDKNIITSLFHGKSMKEIDGGINFILIKNHRVELGKVVRIKRGIIMQISDCMHDLLSIVYNVRNINFDKLKEGQEFGKGL
jgi:hypothetical protein